MFSQDIFAAYVCETGDGRMLWDNIVVTIRGKLKTLEQFRTLEDIIIDEITTSKLKIVWLTVINWQYV